MSNIKNLMMSAAGGESGAWDLSYAYYDDLNRYNVSTAEAVSTSGFPAYIRESSPTGVYVSPDGLHAYVCGWSSSNNIDQYSLSVPWGIGSASYVRSFTSVYAEDITFKADGTEMYVLSDNPDEVRQYSLTTPWSLSINSASLTATFTGLNTNEFSPTGLTLSGDGTKMYVVGLRLDDYEEYNLSTPWDISTASYSQAASTTSNPESVYITPEGSNILVTSSTSIRSRSLSTPNDISSLGGYTSYTWSLGGTYKGISVSGNNYLYGLSTSDGDVYTYGLGGSTSRLGYLGNNLFFKPDGSRVYSMDASDRVTEVAVGTGVDLSDQSTNTTRSVRFKTDGTGMYVLMNGIVYQYDLSTAWDTGTASYTNNSFTLSTEDTSAQDVFFKPDGTKFYMMGSTNDSVYEYNLGTAWDISTASYVQSFSVAAYETQPSSVFFKPDGTTMYVLGYADDVIQYSLSTPWDISTSSYSTKEDVSAQETLCTGLSFNSTGTRMYVCGVIGDDINEYTLSTPWLVTSATYIGAFFLTGGSVPIQYTSPQGVTLSADDSKVYLVGLPSRVDEFDFPSGGGIGDLKFNPKENFWDTRYVAEVSVFPQSKDVTPNTVFFKPDGTKAYVMGTSSDSVHEYSLSTPWDVESMSFIRSKSVISNPYGLFFSTDGTKMYVGGGGVGSVTQYNLGTAWNISTASFVQTLSTSAETSLVYGLFFKDDGTKMYLGGDDSYVYEYALSTPWDISTASFVLEFNAGLAGATSMRGIFFKPDGTELFLMPYITRKIQRFTVLDNR